MSNVSCKSQRKSPRPFSFCAPLNILESFELTQEAKARAAREGNTRPEDVIPIYRKRVTINSSGQETESQARYFVVDNVEALAKFGADSWERVVCVMTTGQAWQFKPYKWNEPTQLFHHGMFSVV
jgi:parafibromin